MKKLNIFPALILTLIIVSFSFAQEDHFTNEWGMSYIEEDSTEEAAEETNEKKKREKSDKDLQLGAALYGGAAFGSGLGDLNANYSVMLLINGTWEVYAIGGHTLGFDKYRKLRIGGTYYFSKPEVVRVGAGLEVGPAYMQKKGGSGEDGFAWIGLRATGDYQFDSGLFVGAYYTFGVIPNVINELGLRVGYYF